MMTKRRAWARGVALVSAMISVMSPAFSAPGDIFTTAAPTQTTAPRPMAGIADGESGVSTNTGAFTYSYPIKVPPGRGGMQPGISLQYSSQASIYGSLAAGWALSGLPVISQDTSGGRLWATNTIPPRKRYQSSLSGNRPLFITSEAAPAGATSYRAKNDSAWIRYQYFPAASFWWKAMSPDGTVYYFGDKDARTSGCTTVSAEHAPVTRIEDAFSNQVDFYYEQGVAGECRIKAISWGQNPTTGQGPVAGMLFTYAAASDPCGTGIAIGSQSSYRTGTKIVTGASQLDKIEAFAFASPGQIGIGPSSSWLHKRTITLGYSSATASCTAAHAPYRALTSIQESAVGADSPQVDLPAVVFGYGDASVNYGAITSPAVPWSSSGVGWQNYNLGWGYRPKSADAWPTVEAMMLDVDGDGLVDRIVSEPLVDANGHTLRCGARWYRNRGPSTSFADAGYIDIPTLKWATDNDPQPFTPWDGGPYAGANAATGANERCALNYQRTAYRNSSPSFLGLCPDSSGAFVCPQQLGTNKGWCENGSRGTRSDCGIKTNPQGDTHFAWRWMDMDGDHLPDLVGSPVTGGVVSYDLQWGNQQGAPQESLLFGTFPACPAAPYPADPTNWQAEAYTMCGGMFPWFVYKNHGNGVFGEARPPSNFNLGPLPSRILYQPIALESTNGDSSVTSNPVGQYQGTVDIDGDGFVDAVRHTPTSWQVFRNDGTGQFLPAVGVSPFVFGTPVPSFLSRTSYALNQVPFPVGVEGLEDFNGDGLTDHWVGTGSMVTARFNDGVAFQASTSVARPGPDGAPSVLVADTTGAPAWYVCRGSRTDDRRAVDLDGDGRSDLVTNNNGNLGVRYNAGGTFAATSSTNLGQGGGFRRIEVDSDDDLHACNGQTQWWMTTQDYIDLDGDGVKEDLELSSTGQVYMRSVTQNAPRRLLVSISNQRGKTTAIEYSSMNGPAVTQAPALGKANPTTGWVVRTVTTTDAFSNTGATTKYAYRYPRVSPDPDAAFPNVAAFRGFEEVTTTHPGPNGLADGSGKQTVHRYDYEIDWSGRLAATVVQPGSSDAPSVANEVRTIEKTSWQIGSLFGGALETYHPYVTERFTCANGQIEATCTDAAAPGYARTTTKIAAKDGMAIVEISSTLQEGTASTDGDRVTETTYQLDATASTYFLHPYETTSLHRVAGSLVMYDKHRSTWSSTNGRKLTDEQWIDAVDANRLITTNEYTPEGNLWKVTDPRGYTIENEYDARKLFVSAVNNAYYQHHYEYEYEYGTGAKLVTRGPDWAFCHLYSPQYCPPTPIMLRPEDRIRVDGLGRTIERWESVTKDPNLLDFQLEKTEIHTYVDAPGVAGAVTHQTAIDKPGGTMRYRSETTRFDGHGRPISTTVAANGSAAADHVVSFAYRHDGMLAAVSIPDPSANDASTVTHRYGFDSLGRPTSIRRPDSTSPLARSGVDVTYNGVTSTSAEFAPTGGKVAETQSVKDRLGRVIAVKEKTGTSTYATTTYTYDPDDNVASITDPQGAVTLLVHDFAGRRTKITRADRTWRYGYDANGNQTSVTTPCTGLGCEAAYTTTTVYDPLNRSVSKVIAPRDLSDADRDLFVADSELYYWDYYGKSRDRIGQWFAYAPNSTETRQLNWFNYDPQGALIQNLAWFKNAGFPLLTRDVMHGYHPSGLPDWTAYRELDGEFPKKKVSYDARGLTSSIDVSFDRGVTWPNGPTTNTRNVAGLITKRRTDVLGSPMTFVESNWTYDPLGRVIDQVVQKSGSTPIARQTLTYFGNDDVKTLQHSLGATNRTFKYVYDSRHQLTSARADATSYFGATYQYSNAGRLTDVMQGRTMSPAPQGADPRLIRDVTYEYGNADPEQVTALINASDRSAYATYTYDEAGNMKTRRYPATNELFEYTYDGKDQLRRVVRKVGASVRGSEEYWYGMNGNRTQVVKRNALGKPTELVWFLDDVEAHYDGDGQLLESYTHISEGTPIARVKRTSPTAAMTIEYQFHGLANNTLAAVAKDGTVNAGFIYAPFGERLESTGIADHKRRFNDKHEDDLSGLAYYGARYYDKTLIGWTQGDPKYRFAPDAAWTQPRRRGLYAFSLFNPLRYLDPDGLDVVLIGASHPTGKLGLNTTRAELLKAATRAGSFPTMESSKKRSTIVGNAADVANALRGRSDKKVAYMGHAALDQPLLDPSRGLLKGDMSKTISPGQLAAAIQGMKEQPTDIYLYGCNTEATGFAHELSKLLPGIRINGYDKELLVDLDAPVRGKKLDRSKAKLVPREPEAEKSRMSVRVDESNKPADADGDGIVTDEEMSYFMRNTK